MLQLSGLARSTFYYYIQHPIKDKYKKEKQEILYIFLANKGRYGYRRILIVLRQKGYTINHKTIDELSILQHEIFHCVMFILDKIGIKLSYKTDEIYAYLIQYITKQIYLKISPTSFS